MSSIQVIPGSDRDQELQKRMFMNSIGITRVIRHGTIIQSSDPHNIEMGTYYLPQSEWFVSPAEQAGEAGCDHDLKEYVGFTERYHYCTKCDHKE